MMAEWWEATSEPILPELVRIIGNTTDGLTDTEYNPRLHPARAQGTTPALPTVCQMGSHNM